MKQKTKVLLISYGAALLMVFNAALWACHVGADGYRSRLDVHANRAFGEAFHAVERLDISLRKLPFASGTAMENAICSEIFSDAQSLETALAILPIEQDALEQISKHVSVVGDYAYTLARAAAEGKSIPEESKTVLSNLAETTVGFREALEELRQALNNGLVKTEHYERLTDALDDLEEDTSAAADTLDSELHALAEQFKSVPALTYDGQYSDHSDEKPLMLAGKDDVSEHQAMENAAAFLACEVSSLKPLGRSDGAIPCWRFHLARNGETTIAVTIQGGEVLQVLASEQGTASDDFQAAVQFLTRHGFSDMQLMPEGEQKFIPMVEEVYFYPDAISVLLSEDGSVLLYDASDYLMHHQERDLSVFQRGQEAAPAVPDGITVQDSRNVILLSLGGEERPCLELVCTASDGTNCLMDINLETGMQECLQLDGESNF